MARCRTFLLLSLLAIAPLALAAPAAGQGALVTAQLDAFTEEIWWEGLAPTGFRHFGVLPPGASTRVSFTLPADGPFYVVGFCDEHCRAMELSVLNTNGAVLASGREWNDHPFVEHQGLRGETFTLEIMMLECREGWEDVVCEFGVSLYMAEEALDPSLALGVEVDPHHGRVSLTAGFAPDPFTRAVEGWGEIPNPVSGCAGWIGVGPDLELNYTQGIYDLFFYAVAEGEGDLNLLVQTPEGEWLCDDDSLGSLNPVIAISSPPSGTYRIWVGSYHANDDPLGFEDGVPATLYISEIDPR